MKQHIGKNAHRDDSGAVVFDNSDKYREIKERRFQHNKMDRLEARVNAVSNDMREIKQLLKALVGKE